MNHLAILSQRRFLYFVIFLSLRGLSLFASGRHDGQFWRSISERNFTAPPNESIALLALEIVDLAAETDPILRDKCGYEILARWVYREGWLSGDELEALRRKLLPGMTFHIGESESDTVFRRSFSALYMSILAAQDLRKPFLSDAAFQEMLATALRCYANERDLRGYVPKKGWAHATAHVADLLKFLARNPKLSSEDQKSIVVAIWQRCRTANSVFVWGEDSRIAAALLSVVDRKDFAPSTFDGWFKALTAEGNQLWKAPELDVAAYKSVRTQTNVLAQLAVRVDTQKDGSVPERFRQALNATLTEIE